MKIEEEIVQKKFRNEWQKATINLLFTHSWMQVKLKELLKPYGITHQQFNVLRILKGQHPCPVSTNTVRDRMLDKMSDVSRIVARLQEKNLVNVCRSSQDKRLVDIILSESGIALLTRIDEQNAKMDTIAKSLTEKDAIELNNLLDKLRS